MKKFLTLLFSICILFGCDKDNPIVTNISFENKSITLLIDCSTTLNIIHTPSELVAPTYSWQSSDDDIVSVTQSGKISAHKLGDATIIATTETGLTTSCVVSVSPIEATSIKLSKTDLTLNIGDTHELTCEILPDNTTDKTVVWASSDDEIVSVTQSGKISALRIGEASIIATTEAGLTTSCVVSVSPVEATSIKLSKTDLTLNVGDTHALTYEILPDNTTDKTVVWASSDKTIATVKDGVITAVSKGSSQIKIALNNGASNICELTVNNVDVDGISLSTPSLTIEETEAVQLIAIITPANATNCDIEWKSSDTSVATVDDNGNVIGVKVGTATITATTADGGYCASCEATIKEISVKGVEISHYSISMAVSETRSFTANIIPFNAANKNVKWTVSDSSVATVDNFGSVTVLKEGYVSVTVTTEDGGYSASCFIEAKPIEQLLSIEASGYNLSMSTNSMNFSLNSKIQNPTNLNVHVESVCIVDKNGSVLVNNNTGNFHIQIIDKDIANDYYCYSYFDGFVIYGSLFGSTTFKEISTYKVIYYVIVNGVDYNVSANVNGESWGNLNN